MKLAIILMITAVVLFFTSSAKGLDLITLTETNHTSLLEEVNGASIAKVIKQLQDIKEPVAYLFIDSPGGSVFDGISLVNYLQTTEKKITCIAKFAASMAHAILESCPTRLGTVSNLLMQHRVSAGSEGTALQMNDQVQVMIRLQFFLDAMEAKRIGISIEKFIHRATTNWTTFGSESVSENLLDGLVTVACSPSLYTKETRKEVKSLFSSGTIVTNGCPLVPVVVEREGR